MLKRTFDITFSIVVIVLFFPFGLLISLLIIGTSKGGVFFKQTRIGQFEKPFGLIKFRTMKPNSDKSGQLTIGMKDPRITKIGYFLRKFKLDEFPQFLNVLIGQMSIVGPRPEVKEYVDLYSEEQRKILNVKPGITDFASIEYFKENELLGKSENPKQTYIEEILPDKIELNMRYIENPTIGADLRIIWKTLLKVIGIN